MTGLPRAGHTQAMRRDPLRQLIIGYGAAIAVAVAMAPPLWLAATIVWIGGAAATLAAAAIIAAAQSGAQAGAHPAGRASDAAQDPADLDGRGLEAALGGWEADRLADVGEAARRADAAEPAPRAGEGGARRA